MIKFKTKRQEEDWREGHIDNRLLIIAYAVYGFVSCHYGINITITDIFRTRHEQIAIYKTRGITDEALIPTSTHEVWRAIDLRSSVFTKKQLEAIRDFINESFSYVGEKKVALLHKIGKGVYHFHLQVDPTRQTIITVA